MDWTIVILIVYLIPLCICVCMALHCLWKHVCKNSASYRAYFGRLQFVYWRRAVKTHSQEFENDPEKVRRIIMRNMLRSRCNID